MSKPRILISLHTAAETEEKAFGRRFMETLTETEPRLVPELVSTSEQFKDAYVDLDHFLDHWWSIPVQTYLDGRPKGEYFRGPIWKRKSALASRGMANHGVINATGNRLPSRLWLESRWDKRTAFTSLFADWVALAKPNIGMLHLFGEAERASLQNGDGARFGAGTFGGPAKPGLPNIGWAMAYGEEYRTEVDPDRISAAGFPVDRIGDVVIVRVTEKLSDVVDDFPYFSRRRAELKSLFRPGLFWMEGEPALP